MARNKEGRPEWFKFWRRNRRQLDIEQLNMESRGIVFTNMMRYFDGEADALLPMTALEAMAFNVLKINIDDSFSDYAEREEVNRANGRKGGRPPKTEENQNNPMGFEKTEKTRREKTEERSQKSEDRSGTGADKPPAHAYGEYGWVKLTDAQYAKLLAHLGEAETLRCIRYIDESAQSTSNKNRWKDWNLVVRRCHREGWGLRSDYQKQETAAPNMSWRTARPSWEEAQHE